MLALPEPAPLAIPLPYAGQAPERQLLEHWLRAKDPRTVAGYLGDLADLADYFARMVAEQAGGAAESTGRRTREQVTSLALQAMRALLALGNARGRANAVVLAYRADLVERGLGPRTLNRRLSAIRSVLKLARTIGMVDWTIEIEGVRVDSIKDTRGAGKAAVASMLCELRTRASRPGGRWASLRDFAIVRLLYDVGLRREEVSTLDLEHWLPARRRLMVLGKKRVERLPIDDVSDKTAEALSAWVAVRGDVPGPLFVRPNTGKRMTGWDIWQRVTALGQSLGIVVRPHGIRHTAITDHLTKSNGNVRAAANFSRHRDLRTVQIYDDNRENIGMKIAREIADEMPGLEDT